MYKIDYAFLSALIPDECKKEISYISRNNMQDAANVLQWHLYNGLCQNLKTEIKLFNVMPVGSFPQYCKKAFIGGGNFSTRYCDKNENIGFCNVKGIRRFIQQEKIYHALYKWCKGNADKKVLFVYTISETFMTPIRKIKSVYPDVKICAIVADLPDMVSLSRKKSLLLRIYEKGYSKRSYQGIESIDAFVLLTKQMADYMKIKQPFCVVEGIATQTNNIPAKSDSGEKNILYTGTLHEKFGILNLLDAFEKISDNSYRLIICGIGDSEDEIKKTALIDKRIDFKGQVTREEALELQSRATVLVNPRQNTEEFVKYSFPSKNLEYMSSGVPLVAYKLDGIPDEYDDYIFYVRDNSADALRDKLVEVCESSESAERAEKAREFVLAEKNEVEQTRKIVELLKEVY